MPATRSFTAVLCCGLLAACGTSTEPEAPAQTAFPRPGLQAANTELLPHIQETHLEMRQNYQEAVDLLDRMRRIPELAEEYALLEKYVESLNQDLTAMEQLERLAAERTLTKEEADAYRERRRDWRARSTVTFNAVGQGLSE